MYGGASPDRALNVSERATRYPGGSFKAHDKISI